MNRKLKIILLIGVIIVFGCGIAIYVGVYVSLYPNVNEQKQDESNINYIAPYINNTHPCYTHGSGCMGELPNQFISYTVWNNDGTINITSNITTSSNGFFELDLEINYSWTIRMQTTINNTIYAGITTFSTFSGSKNCITSGKLRE